MGLEQYEVDDAEWSTAARNGIRAGFSAETIGGGEKGRRKRKGVSSEYLAEDDFRGMPPELDSSGPRPAYYHN